MGFTGSIYRGAPEEVGKHHLYNVGGAPTRERGIIGIHEDP